ncbi:MAG: AAA family ATPase, partial [Mucispirillum sp.]|nr:AAA family ATPase [Mucispirillum sp.]
MLTYLAIKNIAVIERAGLEFGKGLNVITGETGAGKSVLVGALKYLTGDRQGKVASGNAGSKFSAEAIFSDIPCMDKDIVSQYEIEDELIIFRETDENGKNKAFLNGRAVPVNRLKDISEYLIDIHGQHENQFLFNPSKHLSFIDCFVDDNVKNAFETSYRQYRQKYDELERIKNNLEESERLKSIYKFQFDEIDSMNIDVERDTGIEDKIKFLSNMEKVREAAAAASEAIADGEISALDLIEKAAKAVSAISGVSESAAKASECLSSAAANLSDALSYIASIAETGENFSEDELNRLIDRKYKLIDIMKKYGGSLEAALRHKERLAADLDVLNNGSDTVSKLQHETEELLG